MTCGALRLVQNAGLLGSAAGQACSLVALCTPRWLTRPSGLPDSETYALGLWEACVTQDTGGRVCQASAGPRDLAPEMLLAHILMCGACAAGSLGLVAVLLGPSCVRFGARHGSSLERRTTAAGGALFVLAGLATLVPVSYVARVTVQKFWGPEFPANAPPWDYSGAMFSGWVGGFFLLTGGLLILAQLCASRSAENAASSPSKLC
ncbi:putative claudin-25 [Suricata suricatta]|uniref:putative claudin-25 n=1 Tax=Suricata suricatta TaxID=37032 RepID=UPI001155D62B|nr:putative claudin-25 [Suricata suricatta]